MDKILVICHLTDSKCNGQVAKTKDTISFLEKNGYQVDVLNYGKLNVFQRVFKSIKEIKKHTAIIMMPGGKKALFFYTRLISKLKKKNTHYIAIGGWVLSLLNEQKNHKIFSRLKSFNGIYLQNKEAFQKFENSGFKNIYNISSFSSKKPISPECLKNKSDIYNNNIFKFCFYARIIREKGILLACNAINNLCNKYPEKLICLDIYGECLDKELQNELSSIYKLNKNIKYCGVLNDDNAINTLSLYYAMLFPTYYKGEGTPHSVIESFMAALPVIASDWAYNGEVIENKKTGLIFDLKNPVGLEKAIEYAIANPSIMKQYSKDCYKESKKYDSDQLLKPLLNNIRL